MNNNPFTQTLYGDKPDNAWILTWESASKKSAWFQTLDELNLHLKKNTKDIYVGVGFSPDPSKITYLNAQDNKKPIIYRRCPANQIIGIPALYVEIDISSDAHKIKELPPNLESALSLVKDWGFNPSMIVHSGNGIHCYWVFKEPWIFDSPDERQEAANLSKRLCETIRGKAADNNWKMDSVFDLSRILRPPNTQNCKSDPPKDVRLLEITKDRYNPSDFDDLLIPAELCSPAVLENAGSNGKEDSISKILKNVKFDWDHARPPEAKFEKLANIFSPKFRQTYLNKRKGDLSDTSPSGYDMSLCIFAAEANWTDQEMIDLMISHRRINGHLEKTDKKNLKKFATTIVKAREKVQKQKEKDSEHREKLKKIKEEFTSVQKCEHLRKNTSNLVFDDIQILKFTKFTGENPHYILETTHGNVQFTGIKPVDTPNSFRIAVKQVVDMEISRNKIKLNWEPFQQELMACMLINDIGEEQTMEGRYKSWIKGFLTPLPKRPLNEEFNGAKKAFFDDFHKRWWIWINSLSTYILTTHGQSYDESMIRMELSKLKATNKHLDIKRKTHHVTTREGRRTTISLWLVPKQFHPDI